jgi:hypothetical protein
MVFLYFLKGFRILFIYYIRQMNTGLSICGYGDSHIRFLSEFQWIEAK